MSSAIFIPDHQDCFRIHPDCHLHTPDQLLYPLPYQRVIRRVYSDSHGYQTYLPGIRIKISGARLVEDRWQTIPEEAIQQEIFQHLRDDRCAILHYNEDGITDLIVNVDPRVLPELPEHYRRYYADQLR